MFLATFQLAVFGVIIAVVVIVVVFATHLCLPN